MQVSVRGGFSDRNGVKPLNNEIQLYDFDTRTRVHIYNLLSSQYRRLYSKHHYKDEEVQSFLRFVTCELFCKCVGPAEIINPSPVIEEVKEIVLKGSYDDVCTIIESIANFWYRYIEEYYLIKYLNSGNEIFTEYNKIFESEFVGYRFIDSVLCPITNETEISSVKEALSCSYSSVENHTHKALSLLSDRNAPDYENSIKESISAVEAMCSFVLADKENNPTLGAALKEIQRRGINIHPALNGAFSKLYGYTSDADGVRHGSGLGDDKSTFEEAKFMLVACSAFVNYVAGNLSLDDVQRI